MLGFGAAERTLEDAVNEKLWAKAVRIYVLVNGIGKTTIEFGHQRDFAGSLKFGLD